MGGPDRRSRAAPALTGDWGVHKESLPSLRSWAVVGGQCLRAAPRASCVGAEARVLVSQLSLKRDEFPSCQGGISGWK